MRGPVRSSAATTLGIDLGTSAVKAVLVDAGERILASTSVGLATAQPRPGWSEQDPEAWWRAVGEAVGRLRDDAAGLGQVGAIGLSGQMHGLVLLDAAAAALRPAILWNDARAAVEAEQLSEAHPEFSQVSGAAQSPSFWPAKLLWLRRHEPACLAATRHLLPPKDFIRLRLTGLHQTDPCDAGGTLLFDEAERGWSAPILEACGIEPRQLPAVVEGSAPAARLLGGVADAWGLPRDVVVAGGSGDAAANAIGIGAIGDGDATISLGTSAQIFVSTSGYRPAAGLQAFAHALPERWFQAAAVLNGAGALSWAARMLGAKDPAALLDEAEAQYAGPGRLLFLPYLSGERTPHNDPHARGVLFGLTPQSDASRIVQAVIEGVAYGLADALGSLREAGTRIEAASLVGGGARSAFWTRIIADVLGVPLLRHSGTETGPAFGAARLARLALTGEPPGQVCVRPEALDRTLPDPARHLAYQDGLARYRALYQALRSEFRRDLPPP